MKRLKIISITTIAFVILVAILLHNKAQISKNASISEINSFPVTVSKAELKKIDTNLELVGTIVANNDVQIVSESQGKVTSINAKVGDYKPAGSVLINIDDELKLAAKNSAEVNFEKTKKDYERYKALYAGNSITDAQLESAKLNYVNAESNFISARRQYNDTKITTPISGYVTSRLVNVGDWVKMNTVVANVVDILKLKVELNVAEKDVFKLMKGDKVTVTTDVYPGVSFPGEINTISDKADDAHNYPVEITLANSKTHPLKAGMFGRVTFNSASRGTSLVIPREALVGSIKNPQVFKVENGKAILENVVIGQSTDYYLQVLSGLKEGDVVVINGQNNLQNGSQVNIIKQ